MKRPPNTPNVPDSQELQKYNVTQAGMRDVIGQPLYDTQVFPAAGIVELDFFQQSVAGRSLEDTNMQAAGLLTDPNNQLVDCLWIELIPSTLVPVPAIGATPSAMINDFWKLANSGYLTFETLNKNRVQTGPLRMFPSPVRMRADTAVALANAASAADEVLQVQLPYLTGKVYPIFPKVRLAPMQAFNVSINWKTPPVLSQDWKIKVFLGGLLYRAVQ